MQVLESTSTPVEFSKKSADAEKSIGFFKVADKIASSDTAFSDVAPSYFDHTHLLLVY